MDRSFLTEGRIIIENGSREYTIREAAYTEGQDEDVKTKIKLDYGWTRRS